nr:hypothetical protein OG461_29185 [Streptomyces sp. NBC_00995]
MLRIVAPDGAEVPEAALLALRIVAPDGAEVPEAALLALIADIWEPDFGEARTTGCSTPRRTGRASTTRSLT